MNINYVSYEQLTKDAFNLAKRLPRKYDIIVGIPKSGMIPAYVIGFALGLPVYSINEIFKIHNDNKILLIDDSITSGGTMKSALHELSNYNVHTVVIYSDRPKPNVNYYQRIVDAPRVFQWNIFKHGHLATAAIDFDGVLCQDPVILEDDINPMPYIDFIRNAIPLHIPKREVLAIITNRIEKYRDHCEFWLNKHNVKYKKLIMSPFDTANERRKVYSELGGNGYWKGEQAKKIGAKWFIESNITQAHQIKSVINKSVFCTDTMQMI